MTSSFGGFRACLPPPWRRKASTHPSGPHRSSQTHLTLIAPCRLCCCRWYLYRYLLVSVGIDLRQQRIIGAGVVRKQQRHGATARSTGCRNRARFDCKLATDSKVEVAATVAQSPRACLHAIHPLAYKKLTSDGASGTVIIKIIMPRGIIIRVPPLCPPSRLLT